MKPRRFNFSEYKIPAKDSPRAKAQAALFLVSARSIDHVTAEWLAHQFRLSHANAVDMLEREKVRRG